MAIQTPPRPDAAPFEHGTDAGVIDDARKRQRHHRLVGAATVTAVIVGLLILGLIGGGGAAPTHQAHIAGHRIRAGALTVSFPEGWHQVIDRGNYHSCINPVIRLDLASYRLPVGFGKHEGPTVVPPHGILLELVSVPIRSAARPWRDWRLSNHELRRASNIGPNHYAAEVALMSSPATGASAWLGSVHTPRSVLATANRILQSVRINQAYGCQ
jgi:hypothetical protein